MNYVDSDGIRFIAIKNLENRCCYHVAVLQLFHSSKTFNKLMQTAVIPKEYEIMLSPFKEYSIIDDTTYSRVNKAYTNLLSIMSDNVKNGYSSHLLMYYYILPLLNKLYPDQFESIANEVRADPIHFNVTENKSLDVYTISPFLRDDNESYRSMHRDMCERYLRNEIKLEAKNLIGTIIEIYPSEHTVDGGHALFLLKSDKRYYVFDDNTTIDFLERYVNNRNNNIAKLCIYTNDNVAIEEIQQLWGSNAMTARVNNRWEITHNVDKVVVPLYRFLLVSNKEMSLVGGSDEHRDYKKPFIISIICSAILLVILIIEMIIVLHRRQKFQCPCKKQGYRL